MKWLIFPMVSLLCSLSMAGEAAIESASSQLAEQFRAHVRTTKRPLTVFNYFRTGYPGSTLSHEQVVESRDQVAFHSHVTKIIDRTWETLKNLETRKEYVAGNGQRASGVRGFYVALDPAVSAEYGGEGKDWALLEIALEPGMKYLELGEIAKPMEPDFFEIKFTEAVRHKLKKAGCEDRSTTLLFISPSSRECAQVVASTLEKLSLDAILYPFESTFTVQCPNQPLAAMLLVGKTAFARSKIKSYALDSEKNPAMQSDLARIYGLYNLKSGSMNNSLIRDRMLPSVQPLDREAAGKWASANLLGCGSRRDEKIDRQKLDFRLLKDLL